MTRTQERPRREVFEKNARERVEVWAEPYRGHELVHVRVFYQDEKGDWQPTPKGLSLNADVAQEVAEAMLRHARLELDGQRGSS